MRVSCKEFANKLYEDVYLGKWGDVFTVAQLLQKVLAQGKWIEVQTDLGSRKLFSWEIYTTLKHVYNKGIVKHHYDVLDYLVKLSREEELEFVFRTYK